MPPVHWTHRLSLIRAVLLVVVCALSAALSQLNLSPVYGSVPSSLYHQHAVVLSCLGISMLRPHRLPALLFRLVSVLAFYVPTMQFLLFSFSSVLGPRYGPILTELLTLHPLILPCMSLSFDLLVPFTSLFVSSPRILEAAPPVLSYTLFSIASKASSTFLPSLISSFPRLLSRARLELFIAPIYALLVPSRLLFLAIPSLLFSTTLNVHMPFVTTTARLNATLVDRYNYTLLARTESVTGYLSVLENKAQGFRVLRCDHSLLGGEWVNVSPHPEDGVTQVREPIYAVFAMLEAVRLVQIPGVEYADPPDDSGKEALVIGLGIGTTPHALLLHNISTTIVEIDPAVHHLATEFFGLPVNHTSVIGDAAAWVAAERRSQRQGLAKKYDFIIHDVFTGGAEPVALFTPEFLHGLKDLLKPNGVVAINFASNTQLPATGLVMRTIFEVFAPSPCRIFRESPVDSDSESDFTNLVVFCVADESGNGRTLTFRDPVDSDFLGSGARSAFLYPRYEVPATEFGIEINRNTISSDIMIELQRAQDVSAVGHWKIMRQVLPPGVWENW